jgi:hypothetical protein
VKIERLPDNPLITPGIDPEIGPNINGPSLVRAPEWLDDPPGEYFLYFANHGGQCMRLAVADDLSGPWDLHRPHPLWLEEAGEGFDDHIASPDVHVDESRVRMYYHGCCAPFEDHVSEVGQFTRVAVSEDGLCFEAWEEPLGRFYFRVFEYEGTHYALAKDHRGMPEKQQLCGQRVYRSDDGLGGFERGPLLFAGQGARHTAVRVRGDTLDVFYSRIGDEPERIVHATVDLADDFAAWSATEPETILEPEHAWEGADAPLRKSQAGSADDPVQELRDPGVFETPDQDYLLYTVAGERGIALAEIIDG